MAVLPSRSRANLRLDVLKRIDPLSVPLSSSATSLSTDTTSLNDTLLAPAAQSEDYIGDWIYIRDDTGAGPAVGEIARVTDVDFSGSTSKLTVAPAFSVAVISGQQYERHRRVRPNIINDRLDLILGLLRRNVFIPATLITDGDMQTSGVGQWTAASATLTKDTTAAFIRHGAQSLKVLATGANGQALSANVNLLPNTQCIIAADVYITSGDSAKLTFYDVTNSAAIDTAAAVGTGWVHLEFLATTPATCEVVQLRLESQANTDITFWDNAILWPTEDQGIELPSFLEQPGDVLDIVYFPLGTGLDATGDDNAYKINEQSPQIWSHFDEQRDDTGVVPVRYYMKNRSPEHPLWVVARKSYPAFAGATDVLKDADTTVADRYVVANMTAASILDDLALVATEAGRTDLVALYSAKADRLRNDISGLAANMAPPKRKKMTSPFDRGVS